MTSQSQRPDRAAFLLLAVVAAGALSFVGIGSARAAGCPGALVYAADTSSRVDAGWTGVTHDLPIIGWSLRMTVSGCAGSVAGSCGDCAITGLVANAGGSNQRCSNDTAIKCSGDTPCSGSGGHCAFFATPPNPIGAGGLGVCVVNEVTGAIAGTVNVESGALAVGLPVRADLYTQFSVYRPCPTCVGDPSANDNVRGGTCSGGARAGLACDANAASPVPDFGTTSFDCPPATANLAGSITLASQALALGTAASSLTLSAASPNCSGEPASKCFCDTCNDLAGTPCAANADCPDPAGPIGPICGGKRCLVGSNAGAACTVTSECPGGGFCGRPGEPTKPNPCLDDTTKPPAETGCVDTNPLDNEGECVDGPTETYCAPPEDDRGCAAPADCPATAMCLSRNRRCYPTSGTVGDMLEVAGSASPRVDNASDPTVLGSLFCIGASSHNTINVPAGFPGAGRMKLVGTLTYADEVAVENVGAAATVSTDAGEGDGATATDVVETAVTTPSGGAGGEVAILETTPVGTPPPGFLFLGNLVQITAPAGSASDPLALVFRVDGTAAPGQFPATVTVRRNGVAVGDCTNVPAAAIAPDPCVFERAFAGDDIEIGVYTSAASDWDLVGPGVLPPTPTPTFTPPAPTETPTPTPTPTATMTVIPACAPTPEICRTPTVSGKAQLALTDRSPDSKDQLQWKWAAGAATAGADFGDPVNSDAYVLCVYDQTGLLATLAAPAGDFCAGKPCWAGKPKGFLYKDKELSPNGLSQVQLSAGADGKAKIQVKGKGDALPMPDLSLLQSPVTVQLKREGSGICWGASYSSPAIKNDGVQFKDKAD